jgi:hypothetical protein
MKDDIPPLLTRANNDPNVSSASESEMVPHKTNAVKKRASKPNTVKVETVSDDDGDDPPDLAEKGITAYCTSSDSESEDDDMPPLQHHECNSSSSESESDTPPRGKPAFNNKAKSATGINCPPKRWRIKGTKRSDTKKLRKFFPGVNDQAIKRTLDATTQYATRGAVEGTTLRQQIQAPNPVLNIPRRNEDVATDTLYSNTPAIDDGSTAAQFFIGLISKFRSIHSLGKSDKEMVNSLMDEIRKRGAMNRLISDQAKAELSARVLDVL